MRRVPRGEGIERATATVWRHRERDGANVVNLVTDESMISGEKFPAKPGFGLLLILTKHVDYHLRLKVNGRQCSATRAFSSPPDL